MASPPKAADRQAKPTTVRVRPTHRHSSGAVQSRRDGRPATAAACRHRGSRPAPWWRDPDPAAARCPDRSEEHTSELQSLMRISYAVFCLKKKNKKKQP